MTKVWEVFFHHFLAMATSAIVARVVMMSIASPFFHNVVVAMFTHCIFDVL
jgi:hypothetical protein